MNHDDEVLFIPETRKEQICHKCPICFLRFGIEKIRSLKCGHCFCLGCIKTQIKINLCCSVCLAAYEKGEHHRIYLELN